MFKRLDVYPNGAKIPESLPDSYQPASYSNAPPGQNCFNCEYFNLANNYCSAYKAPVKPRYWCDAWVGIAEPEPASAKPILLKKITTSTIEEHFSKTPVVNPKATQMDYSYDNGSDNEVENEEDVIMLNVPLMIRLLEYAREDANRDMDLHTIVENLIDLSEEGEVLEMKDYPNIVQIESED